MLAALALIGACDRPPSAEERLRRGRDSVTAEINRFAGRHNASTAWYHTADFYPSTLRLQYILDSIGRGRRVVFSGDILNVWRDSTGTWLLLEPGAPFIDAMYLLRCDIPPERAAELEPTTSLLIAADSVDVRANVTALLTATTELSETKLTPATSTVSGRCVGWQKQ